MRNTTGTVSSKTQYTHTGGLSLDRTESKKSIQKMTGTHPTSHGNAGSPVRRSIPKKLPNPNTPYVAWVAPPRGTAIACDAASTATSPSCHSTGAGLGGSTLSVSAGLSVCDPGHPCSTSLGSTTVGLVSTTGASYAPDVDTGGNAIASATSPVPGSTASVSSSFQVPTTSRPQNAEEQPTTPQPPQQHPQRPLLQQAMQQQDRTAVQHPGQSDLPQANHIHQPHLKAQHAQQSQPPLAVQSQALPPHVFIPYLQPPRQARHSLQARGYESNQYLTSSQPQTARSQSQPQVIPVPVRYYSGPSAPMAERVARVVPPPPPTSKPHARSGSPSAQSGENPHTRASSAPNVPNFPLQHSQHATTPGLPSHPPTQQFHQTPASYHIRQSGNSPSTQAQTQNHPSVVVSPLRSTPPVPSISKAMPVLRGSVGSNVGYQLGMQSLTVTPLSPIGQMNGTGIPTNSQLMDLLSNTRGRTPPNATNSSGESAARLSCGPMPNANILAPYHQILAPGSIQKGILCSGYPHRSCV